jgi:hypothetical protein
MAESYPSHQQLFADKYPFLGMPGFTCTGCSLLAIADRICLRFFVAKFQRRANSPAAPTGRQFGPEIGGERRYDDCHRTLFSFCHQDAFAIMRPRDVRIQNIARLGIDDADVLNRRRSRRISRLWNSGRAVGRLARDGSAHLRRWQQKVVRAEVYRYRRGSAGVR